MSSVVVQSASHNTHKTERAHRRVECLRFTVRTHVLSPAATQEAERELSECSKALRPVFGMHHVSDCNHRFAAELPITIHWPNALVLVIV